MSDINEKIVHAAPVPPFVTFVTSAVPMVFDNSMSYYEALCALWKWLQDDVIDVINNNANVTDQYIALTNELKAYVENYFDNLDVQEEINNKLDDMAEAGTLQEIITEYIQANTAWCFDNVADMKTATNFVNGSYAQTLGFYSANDGGNSLYKIRTVTNDDVVDDANIIELSDDYLVAELIKTGIMSVKQFGVKGDGVADDTSRLQLAVNSYNNLYVPKGNYKVNAVTNILVPSNLKLTLDEEATIEAMPTDNGTYAILKLDDVDNVEISGGCIKGERTNHTGASGEWGMCISVINGSSNINIHDIRLVDAWGDALYVNNAVHLRTTNIYVDNARRNGISVVSADDYISTNDTINHTNGTAPQAGVDIEPNAGTDLLNNISFVNTTTKNNTGDGIMVYAMYDNDCSVNIINHSDSQSAVGLYIGKSEGTTGYITAKNSYYKSNVNNGIVFRQCRNSDCIININDPVILNCNTANSTSPKYGCAISCYAESTDPDYALGNIVVRNPYSTNTNSTQPLLSFSTELSTENAKIEKVKVFNPINEVNNKPIFVRGSAGVDVKLIDDFEAVKVAFGGTLNIAGSQLFSTIVFNGTTDRTVTMADTIVIGGEYTIKNYGTVPYHIKLPNSQYCLQLTNTAGATITLPKTGDEITLRKFDATHWIVVKTNCTPTVA